MVGQHRVERLLGRGGIAEVYLVTELTFEVQQALKVMLDDDEDRARRLIREGRAQYLVQHPNVVRVFGSLTVLGRQALVMEYVEGTDLRRWLHGMRLRGLWPSREQALDLLRGVLSGVDAMHARGLVHRDLKPANILVAPSAGGVVPKVTDFGLVKDLLLARTPGEGTVAGTIMGTQGFIAPEQIWALPQIDARADVYSLGCILYQLICGRPAFGDDDLSVTFSKVLGEEYADPREHVPDLPEELWLAIRHALVADRRHRIPSCEALWDVIQRGRPALDALGLQAGDPPAAVVPDEPSEARASDGRAVGEVTTARRPATEVDTVALPAEILERVLPATPPEPGAQEPTTRRWPPAAAASPPSAPTLHLPTTQPLRTDPRGPPLASPAPAMPGAVPGSLPDGVASPPPPPRAPGATPAHGSRGLGRPALLAAGALLAGAGLVVGVGLGLVIAWPRRSPPAPVAATPAAPASSAALLPSISAPPEPEPAPSEPPEGAGAPRPFAVELPAGPMPIERRSVEAGGPGAAGSPRSGAPLARGPREPAESPSGPGPSAPPASPPGAVPLAGEPPAAAAEPPMGRVQVGGTAHRVCLRSHADGQVYCAAQVPAGAYDVLILVGADTVTAGTTLIREGAVTSLHCDEAFLTCY